MSALELKVPPVAVTLLLALAMWGLAKITPGIDIAPTLRTAIFGALLTAAAIVGLAGVRSFRRARTTVNPLQPDQASSLVVDGVYRHSRNPQYLALLLALVGWGMYLANPFALVVALAFVPYMNRFQIGPEERALARAYQAEFNAYCRQVRRWL